MEKVRYMISDAASLVDVESHVLRYWEDELELEIPRNEMGHRYYTQDNIRQFLYIKELKEKGYQLKAIRMMVHNGSVDSRLSDYAIGSETETETEEQMSQGQVLFRGPFVMSSREEQKSIMDNADKMAQFTELMTEIVSKAIEANNQKLSRNISDDVGEQVLKEMNYLLREQEEAEEERFRKLDEAIRDNLKRKGGLSLKKRKKSPSQE